MSQSVHGSGLYADGHAPPAPVTDAPTRRVNLLVVLGALIGFGAIVIAQTVDGGSLLALVNLSAALVVIGGTLGAIIVQTPERDLRRAVEILPWLLRPPVSARAALAERIVSWCRVSRREGLLGLESELDTEKDPFIRYGLRLLIDGAEPNELRDMLGIDLATREHRDLSAAAVYESMGGYCPTIGIIGAVLGLTHVMANLSAPAELGTGIAAAFVATIYGVGFANLLFLPVANRLKSVIADQCYRRELVIEGVAAIAQGENPRLVENRLAGFVD